MPSYPELQSEIYEALGRAISKWSSVEMSMVTLFSVANNLSMERACKIVSNFTGFASLHQITDISVKDQLSKSPSALDAWNELSNFVRELSGDRNNMAHSPVITKSPQEPQMEDADFVGELLVGPSPTLWVADRHKRSIDLNELRELDADFTHAMNKLMQFGLVLVRGESFLYKFLEEPVRRRPARRDRQDTKFPKLSNPPQSSEE